MSDQRDLSGTLSRNRKRENERQPEFKGSAVVDGVSYWLSAWVKEGDDGKFFSLAFTRKEQQPAAAPRTDTKPQQPYRERTLDDGEVPF